jgi:very-short-patch-repair endonuclease
MDTGDNRWDWWRRAEREGRLHPGNGPEHTRRVLPRRAPFHRATALAAGQTRRALEKTCVAVAWGVLFLPLPDDTPRQVRGDDPGSYPADIVTRARAQHLRHPGLVIGGWAALALHGLLYWADSAPVMLLTDGTGSGRSDHATAADRALKPVYRQWRTGRPRLTCTPDPVFPALRCVTVPVATAQALQSIVRRKHRWDVPDVPGLTDVEVRCVQLIDAVLQCTTVTPAQITDACRGLVSSRLLRRVLTLVDDGAQSPRETLLRLVIRDALPAGHHWSSQVRVAWGTGRGKSTVLDLACRELKIAVYYDGATHRADAQAVKDIDQIQELKDNGWEVLRVDAELFRNRGKLRRLLGNMVSRAVARFSAGAGAGAGVEDVEL